MRRYADRRAYADRPVFADTQFLARLRRFTGGSVTAQTQLKPTLNRPKTDPEQTLRPTQHKAQINQPSRNRSKPQRK